MSIKKGMALAVILMLVLPGFVLANAVTCQNLPAGGGTYLGRGDGVNNGVVGGAGPGTINTATVAEPTSWLAAAFIDGAGGTPGVFDPGIDILVGGGRLLDGSLAGGTSGNGYYSFNSNGDPVESAPLYVVFFNVNVTGNNTLGTINFTTQSNFGNFWTEMPSTYYYSLAEANNYAVGAAATGQVYDGGDNTSWVFVPEPATMSLFALGLLTLVARKRIKS